MGNTASFLKLILFVVLLSNCRDVYGGTQMKIDNVTPEQWKTLSVQKFYFGHQSVGFNIIDGIKIVMEEHPEIKINIVESTDLSTLEAGTFAHSRVGTNENPFSKTADFVKIVETASRDNSLITVFHKYCYIDINGETNIEEVFNNYKKQISYLQTKYPKTNFIHITIPLTTVQTGPKAFIKKLLGKPIAGVAENIKRNKFNKLLIETYQDNSHVFDLAEIEATEPDGTKTTFTHDGVNYLAMSKGYTNDGGHLNEKGQKIVAEKFLMFLLQINK